MRFLAVSGSLRAASTNTEMLRGFERHAPEGTAVKLFAWMGALPLFNPDLESDTPAPVLRFAEKVARADGLIISSPEYAHGIPGPMKNALDWLVSRFEIPEKPVMLVHASSRSLWSREHLREVLKTMSCRLYGDTEFEIHLIGKSPAEIRALLDGPDNRMAIGAAIASFAAFVNDPR